MSDIVIETHASATTVEAELNYLEFTGERPVTYQYDPPAGTPKRSGVYKLYRVSISMRELHRRQAHWRLIATASNCIGMRVHGATSPIRQRSNPSTIGKVNNRIRRPHFPC
jgi:hypothetical protein